MKKLMFAAAIAASAAAFADPINAISFESNQYASIENATNLTGKADIPDPGREDVGYYFLYQGDGSDSSIVTNVGAAFTDKTTAYYDGLDNYKFLALDTEGGILWRSIGQLSGNHDALGTAQAVAATGTYLDTLVQFTVTEDEAPTLSEDDKLAIWLQAGEGTTNLLVKAAVVDDQSGRTETTFTVTGTTVQPGTWYRLTVKAIGDITDGDGIPGFQIFLDGNLVAADEPTLTAEYLALIDSDSHYADLVAGKYFASLKTVTTLQGVGFQGTGAVDEIVWTEEDLFPAGGATTIEFTLTGAENATVSYVIGSDASQDWDGTSAPISVESGATVTFTAAPESGYTYTGVTAEGWTLDNGNLVCETNSTENITLAVPNAVAITYTLTVPNVANATLTSPASLTGIAPGTEVTLTWTAAEGYTFPNGSKTKTMTVTVNDNMTVDVSEIESSLSKETFTVTITDIENATIAATTNNTDLVDALSENTTTNQYTVEYGATVTVTATAAQGYEYATAPEGWTLAEGGLSISFETNVTAAVELAAPVPTAVLATVTVTVTGGANATAAWTVDGASVADAPATLTEGQTYEVTFTADSGYEFAAGATTTFSGTVGTEDITIAAPDATAVQEEEDWVDNPTTEITAGDTAAMAYPGLAGSALATADAQKLTVWAKENNIAYSDIKADTTGTHTEAYLLNCTVANVATEKEAFVANITIGANGTPVVTAPAGKTYNGQLQLKAKVNLTDATWTPVEAASTTYKFYMYELSL